MFVLQSGISQCGDNCFWMSQRCSYIAIDISIEGLFALAEIKYMFVLQSGIVNAEITAFGCLRDAVILPLIDRLKGLLLLIEEHI